MINFKKTGLLLSAFLLTVTLFSQNYRFRNYNLEDGLIHNFVYSVIQSEDGYLWIGTGEGLCSFNGLEFSQNIKGDSISSAYVCCNYKDSKGNLWFGHNDGSITKYDGYQFINLSSDLATSMINCITEDDKGNLFFATQNEGIIEVNHNNKPKIIISNLKDKLVNRILFIGNERLLLGANDGLYIYHYRKEGQKLEVITPLASYQVTAIVNTSNENEFIIGTANKGIYTFELNKDNKNRIDSMVINDVNFKNLNIQCIFKDNHTNLWLSTFGNGAFKIHYNKKENKYTKVSQYNESNGFGSQYVKCIYQDKEGNMWFGTYGQGLSALIDEAFVFYHFDNEVIKDNVTTVYEDNNTLWIGGENGLMKKPMGLNKKPVFYDQSKGLPKDNITSLYKGPSGNIWIGTHKNGIYKLNPKNETISRFHYKQNSLANNITRITGRKNNLLVATKNGIYYYDLETNSEDHFTTMQGLPHNNINDIYLNDKGELFYATKSSGIFSLNSDKAFDIASNVELEFTCIAEDNNGHLWAGTYGNGVFHFMPDSLVFFSSDDGLKSDYCYSITCDDSNNVWVGHRLGLSKISDKTGDIKQFGPKDGFKGDCNPNALANNKKIYWGTTNGLISYNINKDKGNKTPPITSLQAVYVNDEKIEPNKDILLDYGIYKVKFDFMGVNFKAPEKVTYQYKLEGFDIDWSEPTTDNYAKYNRLEDGKYTFLLRACNEKGVCIEQPLSFGIQIKIPFWKTWWFILISIAAVVFAIIMIIKYRERKQRKFQEYLQELLDERTAEVVKQKEELEVKNQSITESINYARRIQSSMLPSIIQLKKDFSDSFVFYRPRDIVSGDFFWFHNYNDDRYIIVCADCTGHGVPGSLVSMIGMTLIKDICTNKKADSPAELLKSLQKDFQETLNKEDEETGFTSNDGMDISVCEINTKTLVTKFSAAMRPVLIKTKEKIIHLKGTKMPIGGLQAKLTTDIGYDFDDQEVKLEKGDIIYMFSDGYIDQFGGNEDLKFMMGRLKQCIEEVHHLSMEEQYKYFEEKFDEWKGNNKQVDDVLLMGIKL